MDGQDRTWISKDEGERQVRSFIWLRQHVWFVTNRNARGNQAGLW